jgi:hypothetical protein
MTDSSEQQIQTTMANDSNSQQFEDTSESSQQNNILTEEKLAAIGVVHYFLREFIKQYEKACDLWLEKNNKNNKNKKKKADFHDLVHEYITERTRSQGNRPRECGDFAQQSWWANLNGQIESDGKYKPDSVDLVKIWRVNNFLNSLNLENLPKLDLGSLLSGSDYIRPEIARKLANIPEAYAEQVKYSLESQLELQEKLVYGNLIKSLSEFREYIESIVENRAINRIEELHNLISKIFLWYITTFFKGRAIIYIQATYWNGKHRAIDFDRSRASLEFTSANPDEQHTADIDWFISTDRENWPKSLQKFFNQEGEEQVKRKLLQGNGWAKKPISLDENGKTVDNSWSEDKKSLAYRAIEKHQEGIEEKFGSQDKNFLSSCLNEKLKNREEGENPLTDESGYAIPILTSGRRSILGSVMVVSNNANTFNKKEYDEFRKDNQLCEYKIIQEVAHLTGICLHYINQFNSQVYNVITVLDRNKYFPEIVFDIWSTNLFANKYIYPSSTRDSDLDGINESLNLACEIYQEQQNLDFNLINPIFKINAIYERAISENRRSIDVRFGAAVKLCFHRLGRIITDSQKPTLRDMFEVRNQIEGEGMKFAQRSYFSMDKEYLTPITKQAFGIQKFIEILEDILLALLDLKNNGQDTDLSYKRQFIKNYLDDRHVEESMGTELDEFLQRSTETFVGVIRHLNSDNNISAKTHYREYIDSVIKAALTDGDTESLKQLIYRLHSHFHVTLSMLSTIDISENTKSIALTGL